ncbi:Na+/H+ antiporter subunit E [Liberiplasma polymorphum]|uniref:Na+/H+ antiporter subunit E n=1 Tax=Liberiplasma polymorphum TaxID=3374570 RepID=UPI0037757109
MKRFLLLRYKLFMVLLVFWFLLAQNFRIETIIAGMFICAAVTIATYNVLYDDKGYMYHSIKIRTILVYVVFLFVEIYKASFTYAFNLLAHHYEPVIFDIILDVEDPILVGIISNSITLTPGTITIDTDTEKHVITVMTLAKPGATAEELEKPVREKFERLLKQKGDVK